MLLAAFTCEAADRHIRAGATGANDGSDWTNAYTTIPNPLVRGDTYYIAGGTYTGDVTIASAESSTTRVTIRKATVSAHGSETGWDAGYATGQAVIEGSVIINNGYLTIDGVTGSGRTGHGIKIIDTVVSSGNAIITVASGAQSLELAHLEIEGPGMGYSVGASGFKQNNISTTVKGHHLHHIYAHDISQNGYFFVNIVGTSYSDYGLLFEDNVLDNSGYNIAGQHGQGIQCGSGAAASAQSYWIIRNSIFYNVTGTADIACLGYSVNDNFLIYNNLFYNENLSFDAGSWIPYEALKDASSPGVIYFSSTSSSAEYVGIYNNTFYRIGRNTIYFAGTSTNNVAKNNLFLSSRFSLIHQQVTATNNDYWDCNVIITSGSFGCPWNETAQQGESESPVVDAASANFQLKPGMNAIGGGENLYSIFTTDRAGNARPASGAWDIGAYQYSPGWSKQVAGGAHAGGQQ